MKIGLMGAMPQEVDLIVAHMEQKTSHQLGSRVFYEGVLGGVQVVTAFSRWGKVAAAATAMQMISTFSVDRIMFTGVAGAISADLHLGDLIIGRRFFQHDMDARPMYPRYEIPLAGVSYYESAPEDIDLAKAAVAAMIHESSDEFRHIRDLLHRTPRAVVGDIASGDRFVSTMEEREAIRTNLPGVCCVEMEGAAVAQVCSEWNIPFLVVRAVSDSADESSEVDFPFFVREISSQYSFYIVHNILRALA